MLGPMTEELAVGEEPANGVWLMPWKQLSANDGG